MCRYFLSFGGFSLYGKNMSELKMHVGKPAAWIEVEGEDSFDFLQRQAANDLRSKASRPLTYSLWLDRRGRALADSFVLQQSEEKLYLLSYFCPAETLIERLDPYIIADDVTLTEATPQVRLATLWGEKASEAVKRAGLEWPEPGSHTATENLLLFTGRRSSLPHVDIVALGTDGEDPFAALSAAVTELGGAQVSPEEMENERIRSGIAAIPTDIGPGELPQEGHLEGIALSYDKGCYLGQEVMARIRSMGQVRRSLTSVRIENGGTVGPALFHEGKEIGILKSQTSNSPFAGLALIRIDALRKTEVFASESEGKPNVFVTEHRG